MLRLKTIATAIALSLAPAPSMAATFITDPISNPADQWAGIDYWGVGVSQFSAIDQTLTFSIPDYSQIDLYIQGSPKFQFSEILLNGKSIASDFGVGYGLDLTASGYASSGLVSLQFLGDYTCTDCWGDWFGGYVQVTKATRADVPQTPAVPETATWAMMLMGVGFIGFVLRRKPAAGRALAG